MADRQELEIRRLEAGQQAVREHIDSHRSAAEKSLREASEAQSKLFEVQAERDELARRNADLVRELERVRGTPHDVEHQKVYVCVCVWLCVWASSSLPPCATRQHC